MIKTIFLDFDGVLHGEGVNSKGFFEHVDIFCDSIRPYKEKIQLVISSSWREERTLEQLKEIFHEDLREIFVGVTPQISLEASYAIGGREKEILWYCQKNNIVDWIALDDQERFFSPECKNLLLIDCETGLTQRNLKQIEEFICLENSLKINKVKF